MTMVEDCPKHEPKSISGLKPIDTERRHRRKCISKEKNQGLEFQADQTSLIEQTRMNSMDNRAQPQCSD